MAIELIYRGTNSGGAVKSVNGKTGEVVLTAEDVGAATKEYVNAAIANVEINEASGLTAAQISALEGMFKVCAFTKADISAEYNAFKLAFAEIPEEEEPGDTHTHSYTSSITKAAACETAGERTFTCSCGNSYTETIPATGHKYVDGVCSVCGKKDPSADAGTTDGVSSINYTVSDTADNYKEPDNGYVITTSTSHTATGNTAPICAWKLISGKTYSITITGLANSVNDLAAFYWLKASTLDTEPVKGKVTAVTDTVVKTFVAWNGLKKDQTATFTYTAGTGEYLLFRANELGLLNITAEVTA